VPGTLFGLGARRGGQAAKRRRHDDVAQRREVEKWPHHLKGAGNTVFADGIARQAVDGLALEKNAALIWGQFASDEIKQGRFACSVRANQASDLAWFNGAAYAVEGEEPAKSFCNVVYLK
jgi:hypothetical protein